MWPGAGWPWKRRKERPRLHLIILALRPLTTHLRHKLMFLWEWGRSCSLSKTMFPSDGCQNVFIWTVGQLMLLCQEGADQSCNFQPVFKSTFTWCLEEDNALCKMMLTQTHIHIYWQLWFTAADVLVESIVVYPALISGGFLPVCKILLQRYCATGSRNFKHNLDNCDSAEKKRTEKKRKTTPLVVCYYSLISAPSYETFLHTQDPDRTAVLCTKIVQQSSYVCMNRKAYFVYQIFL